MTERCAECKRPGQPGPDLEPAFFPALLPPERRAHLTRLTASEAEAVTRWLCHHCREPVLQRYRRTFMEDT